MKTQLALIVFALGSARRRLGRTLSIMAALVLVTFAFSSVLFLTEALRREYRMAAEGLPDLTVQRLVAGRPALIEERHAKALGQIPGVTAVEPRVWGYYFVPTLAGNFTVVGLDTTMANPQSSSWASAVEGRLPRPGSRDEVVMGKSLARFLGLELGDGVIMPVGEHRITMELVGTFRSPVALWTADVILMSLTNARVFLQVPPGQVTDIAVRLSTPDEGVVAARKIAERIPDARIVDRQLMGRTYDLTFDTRGGVLGAMLMPALIAFLVLAWDRLSGVGPGEWREIGVLKAIGWRTSDVIAARLWEGVLVSFGGAVLGLVAAYVYVFHARAPGLSSVLLGWSSIYPPLDLVPAVNLAQVVVLICLVVVPFVAAGTVPAWRTAMRDPHQLLRGAS
jgi:ABC-type lipoprotein release transport system permease subunit